MSRPAGAASRLVGLQTPPSTYSRPWISTGANNQGTVHDACTASATETLGARGLPKTTRRPLRRSTAVTRSRPSNRAPERSIRPRRRLRSSRGVGIRCSIAARITAPPGAASPSASGANAAPAAIAHAPARLAAYIAAAASPSTGSEPASSANEPLSMFDGRRGDWPAARCADTIAPAEVPTKDSHSRRSKPVASSIPASTPIIHASPRTPPPPSTKTSGGVIIETRLAMRPLDLGGTWRPRPCRLDCRVLTAQGDVKA